MIANVMYCDRKDFTNRETKEQRTYYILTCDLEDVGVGFVYSNEPIAPGTAVELEVVTDRNHKFIVSLSGNVA